MSETNDPDRLLELFHGSRPLSLRSIQRSLGVGRSKRVGLRRALKDLVRKGRLLRAGKEYRRPPETEERSGRFVAGPRGGGRVVADSGTEEWAVPSALAAGALDGDRVMVLPVAGSRRGPSARVTRIVSRAALWGTIRQEGSQWVLVPDNRRLPTTLPVLPGDQAEATAGDLVHAELLGEGPWPHARVLRVLGPATEPGVLTAKLVAELELPGEFSGAARKEAEALPATLNEATLAERRDLRGEALVTIDPATARDFDDAVLAERAPGGGFRLLVAIADVSHYVRPGTALDLEARQRATSIYLPDRVIPMLPERISNDLCSLVPDQDRPAMAVEIQLGADGALHKVWVGAAVIRSRARLTYDEVAATLGHVDGPTGKAPQYRAHLQVLEDLARILSRRRIASGALDLDLPEARPVLSEDRSRVVDIVRRERNWAHRLVEEAMLAANQAVGARLGELGLSSLWRVHEPPLPESLDSLYSLAHALGLRIPRGQPSVAKQLVGLLQQAGGGDGGAVIARRILTTLPQARYAAQDFGHFGLGTEGYLHFTSPIRRYPDLVVHRLLKATPPEEDLNLLGAHCSQRERRATRASWAATDMHAALLLSERVDEVIGGTVAALSRGGMFIQLDAPWVQAFLPYAACGDYFVVAPEGHLATGRRNRQVFRLGQRLRTQVAAAYPGRRQIDLRLVPEDGAESDPTVG